MISPTKTRTIPGAGPALFALAILTATPLVAAPDHQDDERWRRDSRTTDVVRLTNRYRRTVVFELVTERRGHGQPDLLLVDHHGYPSRRITTRRVRPGGRVVVNVRPSRHVLRHDRNGRVDGKVHVFVADARSQRRLDHFDVKVKVRLGRDGRRYGGRTSDWRNRRRDDRTANTCEADDRYSQRYGRRYDRGH